MIVLFHLGHVAGMIYAVYESLKGDDLQLASDTWFNFNILLLLVTAIYPLILSLLAIIMLLQNLLCTIEYDNIYVWHRNSLFRYAQYLIGYTCLAAS